MSRARGFDGQFFDDEKAAGVQLLWKHLVNADDPQAALTSLRAELESLLADFSREWLDPQPDDQGEEP